MFWNKHRYSNPSFEIPTAYVGSVCTNLCANRKVRCWNSYFRNESNSVLDCKSIFCSRSFSPHYRISSGVWFEFDMKSFSLCMARPEEIFLIGNNSHEMEHTFTHTATVEMSNSIDTLKAVYMWLCNLKAIGIERRCQWANFWWFTSLGKKKGKRANQNWRLSKVTQFKLYYWLKLNYFWRNDLLSHHVP